MIQTRWYLHKYILFLTCKGKFAYVSIEDQVSGGRLLLTYKIILLHWLFQGNILRKSGLLEVSLLAILNLKLCSVYCMRILSPRNHQICIINPYLIACVFGEQTNIQDEFSLTCLIRTKACVSGSLCSVLYFIIAFDALPGCKVKQRIQ